MLSSEHGTDNEIVILQSLLLSEMDIVSITDRSEADDSVSITDRSEVASKGTPFLG